MQQQITVSSTTNSFGEFAEGTDLAYLRMPPQDTATVGTFSLASVPLDPELGSLELSHVPHS